MFRTRYSVVIILLLGMPFCLRMIGVEPYPAVLLPSGAFTLREDSGKVILPYKTVEGQDSAGEWKPIEPDLLVTPIPGQYYIAIVDHGFGLYPDSASTKGIKYHLMRRMHPVTAAHDMERKEELRSWMRHKLMEQHLSPDIIRICTYSKIITTSTKKEEQLLINEKIISLDRRD